jgi:hypothetical protein
MKLNGTLIDVVMEGLTPIILHNGRTSNPLNEYAKRLKKVSAKRTKTDEDYEEMASIEWEAGLYWDNDLGVYMPADNLQRMFLDAAKKIKKGRETSCVDFGGNDPGCFGFPIEFSDSKHLEKLRANKKHWFQKSVTIGQAKVIRTRPIFHTPWKIKCSILLFSGQGLDVDDVVEILNIASYRIGIGDWRPGSPKVPGRFGKFTVSEVNTRKV